MLKIKEIRIERFRSIMSMVLPIDPSYNQIAFCGKNNVGKTNTLRAINLFFHPESYQMSEDMPKFKVATGGASIHPRITICFVDEVQNISFTIVRDLSRMDENEGLSGKKGKTSLSSEEINKLLKSCEFIYIESVNVFMPSLIEKLTDDIIDVKYGNSRFSNFSTLKGTLKKAYDAYIEGLDTTLKCFAKQISNTFKQFQPSWSVAFQLPKKPQKFRELISDEVTLKLDDSGSIGVDNKGAGLQRLAAILLCFEALSRQRKKKNTFVCIDEPDVFLHEGLQRKLKLFFDEKMSSMQLFYTTHSKVFVNPCNLKNVFLLSASYESQFSARKNKNIDVVKTNLVDINLESGYKEICDHLGIENYEYEPLEQNNIVVEGECDKQYIENLCKFFNINYPNIISANGANNVEKFLDFFDSYYKNSEQEKKKFVRILLDNDNAGRDCRKKIEQKNYNYLKTDIVLMPNFKGEVLDKKEKPNNEIEDFIYPELFCYLLNYILAKMKLTKIDANQICTNIEKVAFKNNGILELCNHAVKEKNPDDDRMHLSDPNQKGNLAKAFQIDGNKKIQELLESCDKIHPEVKKTLQSICSFTNV